MGKQEEYKNIIMNLLDELMESATDDYLRDVLPGIFTEEEMREFNLEEYIPEDSEDEEDE